MSNDLLGEAIIAPVIAMPFAAVFGAGWLAWKAGELFVEANKEIDNQIREKKEQLIRIETYRKEKAIAAHSQLVEACVQVLSKLESMNSSEEVEKLKNKLKDICNESIPNDVAQIESLTTKGYLILDEILNKESQISYFQLHSSVSGTCNGLSVADFMDDLKTDLESMDIEITGGKDYRVTNPVVLQRKKLNERFTKVVNQIIVALESIDKLSSPFGLTKSAETCYQSCFSGVEERIKELCMPTISNDDLEEGISKLEDIITQYKLMALTIEDSINKMKKLYVVYKEIALAFGEKVMEFQEFTSPEEINAKLEYFDERSGQAKKCSELYEKLGSKRYICFAWDQELKAMGYGVHTRKSVVQIADDEPQNDEFNEEKLPFYKWNENELTQLYSLTDDCMLQVVVHDDGSVSMQTIATENTDEIVNIQKTHCSKMEELFKRLQKNWFISYDLSKIESPEKVITINEWKYNSDYGWSNKSQNVIIDERSKTKKNTKTKHINNGANNE